MLYKKSKDYKGGREYFRGVIVIVKKLGSIVPEKILMEHISNDEVVQIILTSSRLCLVNLKAQRGMIILTIDGALMMR